MNWTCPNCEAVVTTAFCPTCGEHELNTHELTLRPLFDQFFESVTSVDGRLIRSFRYLVTRPGALTVAYLKGQRKPYLGPVALFLIINVLFFAVESLTGGKVFTTPLDSHLHTQPWSESDAVQGLVARSLQAKQTTLEVYSPVFDQTVAVRARSLIILMALAFVPALAIVFYRRHRPLAAHVVFALYFYAFLLLLLCVATTIPFVRKELGLPGLESESLDHGISIGLLIASAVYLYLSSRMAYGERGAILLLKTVLLTVAVAAVVLGYRFVLLLITLQST